MSTAERAATFASEGMKATMARCSLPKRCAGRAPLNVVKFVRETGNDNVVDHRELSFPGLELTVLYVLGNNSLPAQQRRYANAYSSPVVVEITVTSPHWPVAHDLRVNTPRESVERMLGAGAVVSPECASYVNEATQDEATLCYERGRLTSIKWVKWWDG